MPDRDATILLAQQCGLIGMRPHLDGIYETALLEFAARSRAAEREACAHAVWACPGIGLYDRREAMAAIRARGDT